MGQRPTILHAPNSGRERQRVLADLGPCNRLGMPGQKRYGLRPYNYYLISNISKLMQFEKD